MTIYSLDYTSTAAKIADLADALDAAGKITTLHRETTSNLIVSIAGMSGVLRFTVNGTIWACFHGTSYTSGDTINNSKTLFSTYGTTVTGSVAVITDDIIVLSETRSNLIFTVLIGLLDDILSSCVLGCFYNGAGAALYKDDQTLVYPLMYKGVAISAADKYYQVNIPIVGSTNHYLGQIVGLKQLIRERNISVTHEIVGDDVLIGIGYTQSNTDYGLTTLLIEDGNL